MAQNSTLGNPNKYLTHLVAAVKDVNDALIDEVTVTEVSMTESLLTPGLQTTVYVQDTIHTDEDKFRNLDDYKGKYLEIYAERNILKDFPEMKRYNFFTRQQIYRLSNRENDNYQLESFRLDACDPSLLVDAKTWVTSSWKCVSPSKVVSDVLHNCIGAQDINVEASLEPRTYFAENLHPFQVITQQAEVALTEQGLDPSFIHFMTYQNDGHEDRPTHNFRSLNEMSKQEPVLRFYYNGKGISPLNYENPYDIMSYSFPCDFDLLSDVLNGYDENGNFIKGMIVQNPTNGTAALVGNQTECGLTPYVATTTKGTETDQSDCPSSLEQYLLYRKARMGLLDQDKVALRMTIPFNPNLNAGRVIEVLFQNHKVNKGGVHDYLYGSGLYLIASMTHNIKRGGLGITILDCVAQTVGEGVV